MVGRGFISFSNGPFSGDIRDIFGGEGGVVFLHRIFRGFKTRLCVALPSEVWTATIPPRHTSSQWSQCIFFSWRKICVECKGEKKDNSCYHLLATISCMIHIQWTLADPWPRFSVNVLQFLLRPLEKFLAGTLQQNQGHHLPFQQVSKPVEQYLLSHFSYSSFLSWVLFRGLEPKKTLGALSLGMLCVFFAQLILLVSKFGGKSLFPGLGLNLLGVETTLERQTTNLKSMFGDFQPFPI